MHFETLAADVLSAAEAKGLMIAAAESCTGGLIAATLTDIAGSSAVFDRGFVTYSNEAKAQMLGVDPHLIANEGAVSGPVAQAMAVGALERSQAALSVSVTGIAGPSGGRPDKPVGTVWMGMAVHGHTPSSTRLFFPGQSRRQVREATVVAALEAVLEAIKRF